MSTFICQNCSRSIPSPSKSPPNLMLSTKEQNGFCRSVFFCSFACKKLFQDTKVCQVCNCGDGDYVMTNGKSVCRDRFYSKELTCQEKYTHETTCVLCQQPKPVSLHHPKYVVILSDSDRFNICYCCFQKVVDCGCSDCQQFYQNGTDLVFVINETNGHVYERISKLNK
jgi:hypothetical protein